MTDDRELQELLDFDPLGAAERITGGFFQTDPTTARLGMDLFSAHVDAKLDALKQSYDTYSGMPFEEHLGVYADLGFDIVLDDPFTGTDQQQERMVVLWRPDGLLGVCESYRSWRSTNTSYVHFAWRPHDPEAWWSIGGSGSMEGGVRFGDKDVREGLRHLVGRLEREGSLLPVWEGRPAFDRPWTHMGTYMEWDNGRGKDTWDAVRLARFRRLPEHVRRAVGEMGNG